jgi:acid stress-induced BolA-like protein IbaG/YrbA
MIGVCLDKIDMITDILTTRLEKELAPESLDIEMEGNRLSLVIVSTCFAGLNRVKRQQLVYGVLNDYISSGEVHAVSMKTHTPDEIDR